MINTSFSLPRNTRAIFLLKTMHICLQMYLFGRSTKTVSVDEWPWASVWEEDLLWSFKTFSKKSLHTFNIGRLLGLYYEIFVDCREANRGSPARSFHCKRWGPQFDCSTLFSFSNAAWLSSYSLGSLMI